MKRRRVTPDRAAGTRTYHLPFNCGDGSPPQATLMARPVETGANPGRFAVGLAVCSIEDHYVKREGRFRAFERCMWRPVIGTPEEIWEDLRARLIGINDVRPGTVDGFTYEDVGRALLGLKKAFTPKAAAAAAQE